MPCGGARLVEPQYSHGENPGLYSTIHGCRAVLRFINRNTPLDEAGHTRKGVDVASGARSRRFESCLGHQQFVCSSGIASCTASNLPRRDVGESGDLEVHSGHVSLPLEALASSIAARRVQTPSPMDVSQTASPGFSSVRSSLLLTAKELVPAFDASRMPRNAKSRERNRAHSFPWSPLRHPTSLAT